MSLRRKTLGGAVAAATMLLAACSGIPQPSPSAGPPSGVPTNFSLLPPSDFSGLDRVAAFTALHERVSIDYAFTDWKGLDLAAIYRQALPAVQAAAAAKDAKAYLVALRAYSAAFADGHVRIAETTEGKPLTAAATTAQSGGSVGLGLLRLDDGRVVVSAVAPNSPAAKAGIAAGEVVRTWDAKPVLDAAAGVEVDRLVDAPAIATKEYRELEQIRLLTRMPVGTSVDVGLAGRPDPIRLKAIDDQGVGLHLVDVGRPLTPEQDASFVPGVRTLDDGVGYIQIGWLADLSNLAGYPQAIADAFQKAMKQFADAPGIVIDLRSNHGGSDQLAADMCGFFLTAPQFYERIQVYDATNRNWVTIALDARTGKSIDSIMATPQQPHYAGPVAVLLNPRTISSGEGLAQCLTGLPQVVGVGIGGTRASYGLANGEVPMPDGLVFHYASGRTVTADGIVQLDSRDGVGGVQPEVRVPLTMETALKIGRGVDVELSAALTALKTVR